MRKPHDRYQTMRDKTDRNVRETDRGREHQETWLTTRYKITAGMKRNVLKTRIRQGEAQEQGREAVTRYQREQADEIKQWGKTKTEDNKQKENKRRQWRRTTTRGSKEVQMRTRRRNEREGEQKAGERDRGQKAVKWCSEDKEDCDGSGYRWGQAAVTRGHSSEAVSEGRRAIKRK